MAITRSTMRTQVRRRLGDEAASPQYSDAFVNDIIDSRVRTRAGIISRFAPNWYLEHTAITGVDDATDSNYEFYNFPANYRAFIKLERQLGSGSSAVYQNVPVVNAEEQDRYRISNRTVLLLPDSFTNYELTVSIWDNQLRIIPAPSDNSYEFRCKYVRRPTNATSDSDNLDIPDVWQEFIQLDCVVFIMGQLGDPLAQNWRSLRDEEYVAMTKEFRRQIMDVDGMPPLAHF